MHGEGGRSCITKQVFVSAASRPSASPLHASSLTFIESVHWSTQNAPESGTDPALSSFSSALVLTVPSTCKQPSCVPVVEPLQPKRWRGIRREAAHYTSFCGRVCAAQEVVVIMMDSHSHIYCDIPNTHSRKAPQSRGHRRHSAIVLQKGAAQTGKQKEKRNASHLPSSQNPPRRRYFAFPPLQPREVAVANKKRTHMCRDKLPYRTGGLRERGGGETGRPCTTWR